MSTFLFYILKLSVCLIIVWLFYHLVLRRLTFYTWNRWYLLICPTLAFLLPLINIAPVLEKNNWTKAPFVSAIPALPEYHQVPNIIAPVNNAGLVERLVNFLPYLVLIGAVVMLLRLLVQYISLLAMRRSAQLLLSGPVKIYQVNKPVMPFSFGKSIYLNQHLHAEEELKEIIRHEFIHVKQCHTIDIIWSEAICMLSWFNPFAWFIRKAIRQNLEFIADQQVLKTGFDRRQYQYLLLKVIGVPSFSIASNFNFKSLKKRIAMMNKVRSAKVNLVRFALLLPLVAIILVAFRNSGKVKQHPAMVEVVSINDTVPARGSGLPPHVRSIRTTSNQTIVTLKDGKEEKFNLNNEEELAAFEKKYGKMPVPPVPPAMVEVPAHAVAAVPMPHEAPAMTELPMHAAHAVPPPGLHQGDCYNEKGYCLHIIETKKGTMVLAQHKSKREAELIYLDDWKKDKKYEDKFGKLPESPHPPHAPVPSAASHAVPTAPMPPPKPIEQDMPDGVSSIHVKDYDVTIITTDGKTEKYNLRIAAEKEAYEKKYDYKIHGRNSQVPHTATAGHGEAWVTGTAVQTHGSGHAQVATTQADAPGTGHSMPAETVSVAAGNIEIYGEGMASSGKPVKLKEREVVAVITNKSTFKDLEQLKRELKEKGITVEWIEMKSHDGELVDLEAKMSEGSAKCHFHVKSFKKFTISRATDDHGKTGFHVQMTDGTVKM